jgi:hypothetical protein
MSSPEDKTLTGRFNEPAGEMPQPEYDNDLSGTANAQLDNAAELTARMNEHDQRWKAVRGNLAAGDVAVPTNDLGGNEARNLKDEYDRQYSTWYRQGIEIDAEFGASRNAIREAGTTLVDQFEDTAYYDVISPDAENDLPLDMRAAFNEDVDQDYWLDEDHEEDLDFSDEPAPLNFADHDSSNGNEGGHSR